MPFEASTVYGRLLELQRSAGATDPTFKYGLFEGGNVWERFQEAIEDPDVHVIDLQGRTLAIHERVFVDRSDIIIQNGILDHREQDPSRRDGFRVVPPAVRVSASNPWQGRARPLTANSNAGATSITVATHDGIQPGDYGFIRTNTPASGQGAKGEAVRVRRLTSTGNIHVLAPLYHNYTTAENAWFEKIDRLDNVWFRNIKMLPPHYEFGVSGMQQHRPFNTEYLAHSGVIDCDTEGWAGWGANFYAAWDCHVHRLKYRGVLVFPNEDTVDHVSVIGRGVGLGGGAQGVTVAFCKFEQCRHGTGFGGDIALSRNCTIVHNYVEGGLSAGLDAHRGVDRMNFSYNFVRCRNPGSAQATDGILYQGSSPTIVGNTLQGWFRHGVYLQLLQSLTANHEIGSGVIANNTILGEPSGSSAAFINVQVGDQDAEAQPIRNLRITGNAGERTGSSRWGYGVRLTANRDADRTIIADNSFPDVGISGVYLDVKAGRRMQDPHIVNNVLHVGAGTAPVIDLESADTNGIRYGVVNSNGLQGGGLAIRGVNTQNMVITGNVGRSHSTSPAINVAGTNTIANNQGIGT